MTGENYLLAAWAEFWNVPAEWTFFRRGVLMGCDIHSRVGELDHGRQPPPVAEDN